MVLSALHLPDKQPGLLQCFDVLGGASERHGERLCQFAHVARALFQLLQHGPPGGIGKSSKDSIQVLIVLFNHKV